MRIAVFYNLFFGGAKRVVFEHVKGLKNRGHIVDVYTTDGREDLFDFSKVSDSFFKFKPENNHYNSPIFKRLWKDIGVFYFLQFLHKKIANIIDKKRYDIVLVHPDRDTQAPFILKYLQTPSVYYCEEPLRIVYDHALRFKDDVSFLNKLYEASTRYIRKKIDRENTRLARYHLASCLHIRERMIESYEVFPKVSYPGIDTFKFQPLKVKKRKQILFIGNKDVATDGYDLLQRSIEIIPLHIRPSVIIVSWKKNKKHRLSETELVRLYNESVLSLCLGRLETFGLVPLESMACGIPVIATNVSGHRETIISGKTGFLVDFEPTEIAHKIMELIKNPDLAFQMGQKAQAHVQKEWTWEKRVLELELILKKWIEKK